MPPRATAYVARNIFLIATEESGDRLGASLMKVLRQRLGGAVRFEGVGGQSMAREGLASLFPIEELSIMGLAAVVKQLPMILRRIRQTADAVTQASPDILVIIDSPDFTHRVARRVRARDASIPIVDYVSPSVWAWRPGRARAMLSYVDHVLALLPFEPDAYRALRGPPCSYVGHPLIEQIGSLRPGVDEQKRRDAQPPVLLVLPGSRRSERAAFRIAHAAFVKSGTSTLELALAGVPMVAAYRAGAVEAWIMRRAIRTSSVILANLVIGENVVPEFIQEDCTAEKLAPALREILSDSPLRRQQLGAFSKIDAIMSTSNQPPSVQAADIVLATLRKARGSN